MLIGPAKNIATRDFETEALSAMDFSNVPVHAVYSSAFARLWCSGQLMLTMPQTAGSIPRKLFSVKCVYQTMQHPGCLELLSQ